MKIIFLDIDGVLATDECFGVFEEFVELHMRAYRFDKRCVMQLNRIIQETSCEIVLTSDWRLQYNEETLKKFFLEINKCAKAPVDQTISLHRLKFSEPIAYIRRREIISYLTDHPEITSWCAIDDMDLDMPNFVRCTDDREGLTEELADSVIEMLQS
jgi:hypothetical protein